jgi:hypothetical protein
VFPDGTLIAFQSHGYRNQEQMVAEIEGLHEACLALEITTNFTELTKTPATNIHESRFTSPPPKAPGSSRSKSGSPRSNARLSPRGNFTSISDLARKLRRDINAYSANARPIRWKYSDPAP